MDAIVQFLPYVAIFAVFWLLLIRPQQKRAREQQERQESLTAGTRVMTTAGIFGTVQHVGKNQLVLEIAPGVEMTVIKGAIAKTVSADEDEFEYEDAASTAALSTSVPGTSESLVDPLDADVSAASDDARFHDAIAGFHADSAADPLAPTKPSDDDSDGFDGRPGSTKA